MQKEIWKPIKGYKGLYEVSNFGRVKSLSKNRPGQSHEEMMKKLIRGSNGYFHVSLYKNSQPKTFSIHRLVIETFCGVSDLHVNHKDGNKENNYLANLEYCTHQENIKHAVMTGLRDGRGEKNVKAKLTRRQIREIRINKDGLTKKELAKRYGIYWSTVYKIVNGETWAHV